MANHKLDWKWVFYSALLFILALAIFHYKDYIIEYTILFFYYENVTIFLGIFSAIIIFLKKLKWGELKFEKSNFTEFDEIFKKIVGILSKPTALVCSYSLLRGLYLQKFENNCNHCFFPQFDELEIDFLWVAAFYLLVDSLRATYENCLDVFLKAKKPVAETEESKTTSSTSQTKDNKH